MGGKLGKCLACGRVHGSEGIRFDSQSVCQACIDRAENDKKFARHLMTLREQHPICPKCGRVMQPMCLGCGGYPMCDCGYCEPCGCVDYEDHTGYADKDNPYDVPDEKVIVYIDYGKLRMHMSEDLVQHEICRCLGWRRVLSSDHATEWLELVAAVNADVVLELLSTVHGAGFPDKCFFTKNRHIGVEVKRTAFLRGNLHYAPLSKTQYRTFPILSKVMPIMVAFDLNNSTIALARWDVYAKAYNSKSAEHA